LANLICSDLCCVWCFGLAGAAKGSPPSFVQKPAIRQVEGNIIIECKLSSDPAPQITWLLNNTVVQSSDRYKLSQTQANGVYVLALQISNVGVQDGGEYKVLAKNARGEATATINLNLEGKIVLLPKSFPLHNPVPTVLLLCTTYQNGLRFSYLK